MVPILVVRILWFPNHMHHSRVIPIATGWIKQTIRCVRRHAELPRLQEHPSVDPGEVGGFLRWSKNHRGLPRKPFGGLRMAGIL